MSAIDVKLYDQSATPVAFFPRLKDLGNGVRKALHGLTDASDNEINPAPAEGIETVRAAVAGGLGGDGATPPAIAGTGVRGWLRAIYERLSGTVAVSLASAPLPAGAATEATLLAVKAALLAQVDFANLFVTDGTNVYVRREVTNEGTGAVSVVFETMASAPVTPPNVAALVPAPSASGGSGGTTRTVEATFFDATANGTGITAGDVLARVLVVDVAAGTIVGTYWHNVSVGTVVSASASGAYVEQAKVLPTGASTEATLLVLAGKLDAAKASTDAVSSSINSGAVASPPATADPANPTLIGGVDSVRGATSTNRGGTIAAGGTAQQRMPASAIRRGFVIQNQSAGDLYVNGFGAASAGQGSLKIPVGALYETPVHHVGTGAISIVGATTGQAFYAREF